MHITHDPLYDGFIDGKFVGTWSIPHVPDTCADTDTLSRLERDEYVDWDEIADPMDDDLYLHDTDHDGHWQWRVHTPDPAPRADAQD